MPRIKAADLAGHHALAWAALASGLDAVLIAQPYDQATLADIAKAAGMARNTIYNYARDKQALVAAVTEYVASRMLDEIDRIARGTGPPPERLSALVTALMSGVAKGEHRAVIAHAILMSWSDTEGVPLGSKVAERITDVVAQGAEEGVFRDDFELTLELLAGTAKAAAERIFARPAELDAVCAEAVRILLAGLSPRPPAGERQVR